MLRRIRNLYAERVDEHFLKKEDSWITFVFDYPFSVPLVRLMQRLNLKVHPNVITFATLPPIALAAYFFFTNNLAAGAFCYLAYFIGDGVDGKWARVTGQTSKLGGRLDYFVGALGILAMYLGLWYSQYYSKGDWLTGGIIIAAHYIIVVCIRMFIKQPYYKTILPRVGSYYSTLEEGVGTFFWAPLFNVVNILFPVLVALQLISFIVLLARDKERPDVGKRVKELVRI